MRRSESLSAVVARKIFSGFFKTFFGDKISTLLIFFYKIQFLRIFMLMTLKKFSYIFLFWWWLMLSCGAFWLGCVEYNLSGHLPWRRTVCHDPSRRVSLSRWGERAKPPPTPLHQNHSDQWLIYNESLLEITFGSESLRINFMMNFNDLEF